MERLIIDINFYLDPQIRQFCGPLFFTHSIETAQGNIPNNGSFGLVDTGEKKLLVTCNHVWEAFKKLRSENPNLKFCLSLDMANPIYMKDPESLLIDRDKHADLVTFNMEELLPACGGLQFYNVRQNPPPKINAGDKLYFIGFPGKGREVVNNAVGFPRQGCATNVTEVGDFQFFSDVAELKIPADEFGGFSGSPCFLTRDDKPIRLVGFTTGYVINRISFTYAARIKPDGTINPYV